MNRLDWLSWAFEFSISVYISVKQRGRPCLMPLDIYFIFENFSLNFYVIGYLFSIWKPLSKFLCHWIFLFNLETSL